MLDAGELYERGTAAHRAGRYATARRDLEGALTRTDDPDLTARIELALGYVDAETGDADSGLRRLEAAQQLRGVSEVTAAVIRSQLALVRMRRGEEDEALNDFADAVALLSHEPEHLGRALLNRGNLHLQRRDPAAAVTDLEAARSLLAEAGHPVQAAKAEHNLGYARLLTGDVVGALQQMEAAAEVLAPLSAVTRSVSEQDRAEVLLAAGRPTAAVQALRAAVAAYGAQRLRRFQAECELVLARTLLVEDPDAGRTVARRAARRFERHGSTGWALRAEAMAVMADIARGGRAPRLLARADELTGRLRDQGYLHEADEVSLYAARVAVRRSELDDASHRLRRIRTSADTPVTTRLLAREVRAEHAVAAGHRARALQEARNGLTELHAWQASFGSLELHTSLVGHGRGLARMGLSEAVADGRPEVVLEWSERARALSSRVVPVRPPHDPDLAAELAALRSLGERDTERARELREHIRQRSWYAGSAGAPTEPVALDELAAGLDRHEAALIAYLAHGDELTALAVTPDETRVVPLGALTPLRERLDRAAADLDMAAEHPDGQLGEMVRASLHADLADIAKQLVDPLLNVVGDRRLVLTPSARLAGTPWTLLPGFLGRPLTVPTSATRWLEQVSADPGRLERIGLVAGPHVPRAGEEVGRAASAWGEATVLEGEDATAARVAEVAGRVDVLHLAGHGRHPGDNPLFSAVELADGPWFGYDIDRLPRAPSVVVLSACELGRASVRSGEEAVGMTAAWLYAGARSVLSSPALVADDAACEALAAWHDRLAAGAAPADALAEVVEAAEGAPVPFCCFGAGF